MSKRTLVRVLHFWNIVRFRVLLGLLAIPSSYSLDDDLRVRLGRVEQSHWTICC
jgi:hypothetical protein